MSNKPLLASGAEAQLQAMQSKCFELAKVVDKLKTKNKEIGDYTHRDYYQNKEEINDDIETEGELFSTIQEYNDEISDMDIPDSTLHKQQNSQKDMIYNKAVSRHNDAKKYIREIREKELRFPAGEYDENESKLVSSYDDKILLQMTHHEEVSKQRTEDLEQIKSTAAQLNSLAKNLKNDVHQQGELLNSVEENVIGAMENVNSAEEEIKAADKIDREGNKKTIWIIVIIVFVVLAISIISLIVVLT